MEFYIVDAFTDHLFGGNPAGVVILDKGVDFPESELMRKIAAELRYSETAFVKPLVGNKFGENEFQIRYFTPAAEVDLCGHATIGSFFALQASKYVSPNSACICNTLAGRLNISISKDSVLMDMGVPKVIDNISDQEKLHELYSIMGISDDNQGVVQIEGQSGVYLLPEMISTGLPDIMLPVCSEKELAAISPDFNALSLLSEKYMVVGVHAFTVNTKDNAIHCRNFAPLYDIDEEAATGTSNGALSYYLYKNGLLNAGAENLFIQGEAMGRPSKIRSKLTLNDGQVRIQVGGSAVILAQGELKL